MFLPIEQDAHRHLEALKVSELLLRASLETGLIADLQTALESAAESGLREDELIEQVQHMKAELEAERRRATLFLRESMFAREPAMLRKSIQWSAVAQVCPHEVRAGIELADFLEDLLADVEKSVGIDERQKSLQGAREGEVPASLIARAEIQVDCLREVLAAHEQGDVPRTRKALKMATVAGVKDVELSEIRLVFANWTKLNREVEVSVSLGRTQRLTEAIDVALAAGITPSQLTWAQEVLVALELRDKAEAQLRVAMGMRKCEELQGSLKHALDVNLQEKALIDEARQLLHHLRGLRLNLREAVTGGELSRVYHALQKAMLSPALPEEDIVEAAEVLQELREDEISAFNRRMKIGEDEKDFRAMDALAVRGKWARELGMDIEVSRIQDAVELSRDFQQRNRTVLEAQLHSTRMLGHEQAGATEFKMVDSQDAPLKVPVEHDVAEVPFEVVEGEVHVYFQPYGKRLVILPRDIVHMQISVVAPEQFGSGTKPTTLEVGNEFVDIRTAEAMAEKLICNIRAMLAPVDNIRRMNEYIARHDGANHRLELDLALYLRARHTARDVVEAIFERAQLERGALSEPVAAEHPEVASLDQANKPAEEKQNSKRPANVATRFRAAAVQKKEHKNEQEGKKTEFTSEVDGVAHSVAATLTRHWTDVATGVTIDQSPGAGCLQNLKARVLRKVRMDLSWHYPVGLMDSLDCSVFVFDDEKLVDVLTHDGKKTLAGSVSRKVSTHAIPGEFDEVVQHAGDVAERLSRSGKKEVYLRLDALPPRVKDLVIVLSAHNSRDLLKFDNISVKIFDHDARAELASFDAGQGSRTESIIMCSLSFLSDKLWHVHGMGVMSRGTTRDMQPILDKLLSVGYPRDVSMRRQEPVLLAALQKKLELQRPVKSTQVSIGDANRLQVRYVVELVDSEAEPGDSVDIVDQIREKDMREDLAASLSESGAERFQLHHLRVLPSKARAVKKLHVDITWRYPHLDDIGAEERDCRYIDMAAICFSGRALQEVIDYRGAHGVRLVHNGIFDESGVWLGVVGVGDATDGAARHMGLKFDDLLEWGSQSVEIDLNTLPPGTTDIFFVASSPVVQDIGMFEDVTATLRDAENLGHEVLTVTMPTTGPQAQAALLCRVSKVEETFWKLGAFRSGSPGTAVDYRPLLAHLRNIQERKWGRNAPMWPHRVSRLDQVQKSTRVMVPLAQWRKTATSRRTSGSGSA